MFDRNGEFSFCRGIHVRTDMRINISISVRPTINKFSKQVYQEELTQMRLIKQVMLALSR